MKKVFFPFILLMATVSVLFYSCGKHVYAMNYKELNNLAEDAREPGYESFVVYENLDTVKGKTLKSKSVKKEHNWIIDGNSHAQEKTIAYQDKYGYYLVGGDGTTYGRVFRGKICLYTNQVDNSKLETTFYTNGDIKTRSTGSVNTSFYLGRSQAGKDFERVTWHSVERWVKDYEPALQQFRKEFPRPKNVMNDYRALVRILTVYDKKPE